MYIINIVIIILKYSFNLFILVSLWYLLDGSRLFIEKMINYYSLQVLTSNSIIALKGEYEDYSWGYGQNPLDQPIL